MRAKFQGYQITRLCFIAIFAKCMKRRGRKKQRKMLKLWLLISQKRLWRFPSNWNVDFPNWRATLQQI